MRIALKKLAFLLAIVAAPALMAQAHAQGRASHIDKVANKRLAGHAFATFTGMSYESCEARCLGEPNCVALEHFRGGGRILGRNSQCKLFSSVVETRDNRFADIGYKRPGAGPKAAAEARKKAEEQKQAEIRRLEEAKKMEADARAAADEARREQAQKQAELSRERAGSAAPPPSAAQPPGTSGVARDGTGPGGGGSGRGGPGGPSGGSTAGDASPPGVVAPPQPPPAPVARAPSPSFPDRVGSAPPPPVAAAPPPAATTSTPRPQTRSLARPPEQPATTASDSPDWDVVPVFYGTDRKRRDQPKRIAYSSDRGHALELGRALVTVPKSHQVPNVERPWVIKVPYLDVTLYAESEDPKKHFTIKELTNLPKDELIKLVRERFAKSATGEPRALVMIHGYNNGFDDALYRTAQIAYDLKYDGVPFLYSWPSGGGITSYPYDRESAQQSEQYLSKFLQVVLDETGARNVSIIAHSMGNQPLLQVLRDLRITNPTAAARINQVILAAPDVDRDNFEYLAGQIKGVARGVTMYASSNDVALSVSRRFAGGVPRAGDVPVDLGPSVVAGVDTIDVSALSTEYLALNHSNYAEKTALIQDIGNVLLTGERPPDRRFPILQRITSDKGDYWRYPK